MAEKFLMNFKNTLEIDTKGGQELADAESATWAFLSAGITTMTPSAAETADTSAYWDGEGQSETDITGKNVSFAIAGHRKHGDAAQDYIASKFFDIGDSLRTLARWKDSAGNTYTCKATMTAIVPFGGNANAKETFSCTIAFNGKPEVTTAPVTP